MAGGTAMLQVFGSSTFGDCTRATRRDFLAVGAVPALGLTLPGLFAQRAFAAETPVPSSNTSVVWLWLNGGPSHIETFDPKPDAPREYRSVTGHVATSLPGVALGGTFEQLATRMDRLAIVRSFAHQNSGHGGGTHWVMTGYDNRQSDAGGKPNRPSLGSIVARMRGANVPGTGMPTYVRQGSIGADGPAFLGASCAPFDPQGPARKNLSVSIKQDRLDDRRSLLSQLDRFQRTADASGLMEGLDAYEQQAFNLVLGSAPAAFDLAKEEKKVVDSYGKDLGQQMLIARRLCEAGCGFVTVSFGGWDMHNGIEKGFERRGAMVDRAVAAFLDDVAARGLSERILLVITGEFGRTPRVNRNAGRDHWAPLSTLALAGGGLRMGQVVGESSAKAETPRASVVTPQDLAATVLQVLGISPALQVTNPAGRPVTLVENGRPIRDLFA